MSACTCQTFVLRRGGYIEHEASCPIARALATEGWTRPPNHRQAASDCFHLAASFLIAALVATGALLDGGWSFVLGALLLALLCAGIGVSELRRFVARAET